MKKQWWQDLMTQLGFAENRDGFEQLKTLYTESHRYYHNASHITDCLEKSHLLVETKENTGLQLAIWYHDAIYQPFQKDNELKSAELAVDFLIKQGASSKLKTQVFDLIMATVHKEEPNNETEAYIQDIDISILGATSTAYETYCQNIRKEYRWVPGFVYRRNRIAILKMFLGRKQLYRTEFFREGYEEQARENIARELTQLGA